MADSSPPEPTQGGGSDTRTRQQCRNRLTELEAHGFIEGWTEIGVQFMVEAGAVWGPYSLAQLRAWLNGVEAMGAGDDANDQSSSSPPVPAERAAAFHQAFALEASRTTETWIGFDAGWNAAESRLVAERARTRALEDERDAAQTEANRLAEAETGAVRRIYFLEEMLRNIQAELSHGRTANWEVIDKWFDRALCGVYRRLRAGEFDD